MGFPMSIIAPKARKYLSADALFPLVQSCFATIPDPRYGDVDISLTDALMSAFAMFSLKAPSLLAFDKERAEGNLHTIYGIQRVPCDTHMREILDPVSPKWLRPVFKSVFRQLQRGKALEAMVFLDGHYLLALDGTGYFSSTTIHCESCLQKVHRNGSVTYSHQMLGAAIIHPDMRAVIPLMPEPIGRHDGTDKNDCERNAAKRFVAKLRQDHPHLKFIVTEDSLGSNAPHLETLRNHALHFILGVKEGDHAFLFQQVQAAEHAGRVTSYERHDRAAGVRHRFRFVNDMPLNASHPDVRINFIEYWEIGHTKCRLSNNFSRLTYKFSRVFEPLKAENRPVPTHIFSVQQAAPFSHNQCCANSPFHNETKIYESGHNTIRKAHLHDDMKNYGSETETMCPFSGKPLDTTTVIMLHRKVMWQDHKSHMVLTH